MVARAAVSSSHTADQGLCPSKYASLHDPGVGRQSARQTLVGFQRTTSGLLLFGHKRAERSLASDANNLETLPVCTWRQKFE